MAEVDLLQFLTELKYNRKVYTSKKISSKLRNMRRDEKVPMRVVVEGSVLYKIAHHQIKQGHHGRAAITQLCSTIGERSRENAY